MIPRIADAATVFALRCLLRRAVSLDADDRVCGLLHVPTVGVDKKGPLGTGPYLISLCVLDGVCISKAGHSMGLPLISRKRVVNDSGL